MIKNQRKLLAVFIRRLTISLSLFFLCSLTCIAKDTLQIIKSPSSVQLINLKQQTTKVSLDGQQKYYLFIFLSPDCPLCQNYSKDLNQLFTQYKDRIAFYGIIPGKAYSVSEVKEFSETYKVKFDLLFDKSFQLAKLLQATTTPQVFLVNSKNEIVYSGRIDNWATSIGVKRTIITDHFLEDAIFSSVNNIPVKLRYTHPVGCLINNY